MIESFGKLGKKFEKRRIAKRQKQLKQLRREAKIAKQQLINLLKSGEIFFTFKESGREFIIKINFVEPMVNFKYFSLMRKVKKVYPEFSVFSYIIIRTKRRRNNI